jgi:hypothetical protein
LNCPQLVSPALILLALPPRYRPKVCSGFPSMVILVSRCHRVVGQVSSAIPWCAAVCHIRRHEMRGKAFFADPGYATCVTGGGTDRIGGRRWIKLQTYSLRGGLPNVCMKKSMAAAGSPPNMENIISLRTLLSREDDLPIFHRLRGEFYPQLFEGKPLPPTRCLWSSSSCRQRSG